MKKLYALPLAAAALVLTACSSEKPGTPTAAPTSAPGQSASSAAPPSTGGGNTASLDPCSLVSAADLSSYGTFKAPESGEDGGARTCTLTKDKATAGEESLTVSVGVRDSQGLDGVNDAGNGKTNGNVQGRKAVLVPTPPTNCLMALEAGATSRVDVVTVSTDPEKACGIAEKVADIVAPKLPKS
ncbi:DUF3558 domain-containing protein [Amycolatopsis regifaucium]|uniref:DUF3558 domain-containing protein n=1 Tax=Amycolatopsis regifaucium TaxID=546365 RepID=A0A154MAP5_9PSEU|nr:DUF3558 domain-containing protein [Amycolatopsis regifaucium]KZB81681.1 hypothetical protein AVL48_06750 [Amycolatopsis regifaucium]OKA06254.1 hypothetical protein ATP06_0224270 [Amycolatopsis regifaucium]SFG67699.1 Protein of unknown function [Amycolatopsis regifaucium]